MSYKGLATDKLFAQAIEAGDLRKVKKLLSVGEFDINARESDEPTLLEFSIAFIALTNEELDERPGDDFEIIQALVEAKADVNTINIDRENITPLILAMLCLEMILEKNTNRLCEKSNLLEKLIVYLLEKKADPNHSTTDERSPLCMAAFIGNVDIIKSLIAHKAGLEKTFSMGQSPIYLAAQNNHVEAIHTLAIAKADLNKPNLDDFSPLGKASQEGYENAVDALLTLKADTNVFGCEAASPISKAALRGHFDVVKKLVAAKAQVNPGRRWQSSPLNLVCERKDHALAEFLLTVGASPIPLQHFFTSEVNAVLARAIEGEIVAKPEIVITNLLLEQAEKLLLSLEQAEQALENKLSLRTSYSTLLELKYLSTRLIEMEAAIHSRMKKENVVNDYVQLLKKINSIKSKLIPSLRLQALCIVQNFSDPRVEFSVLSESPAQFSNSRYSSHASLPEAATQLLNDESLQGEECNSLEGNTASLSLS
jgi:ankyrin repeat protein